MCDTLNCKILNSCKNEPHSIALPLRPPLNSLLSVCDMTYDLIIQKFAFLER